MTSSILSSYTCRLHVSQKNSDSGREGRSPEPELVLLFSKTNASVDLTLATLQVKMTSHTNKTCIKSVPDTFISLFPWILHHWIDDINEDIGIIAITNLKLRFELGSVRHVAGCVSFVFVNNRTNSGVGFADRTDAGILLAIVWPSWPGILLLIIYYGF